MHGTEAMLCRGCIRERQAAQRERLQSIGVYVEPDETLDSILARKATESPRILALIFVFLALASSAGAILIAEARSRHAAMDLAPATNAEPDKKKTSAK